MANNECHTPVDLVDDLTQAVGGFDLDPCSGAEPEPIAPKRYTKDDDGLAHDWEGKVFVNPPYERYVIDEWAEKIREEATRDAVDLIVALVPARVNTNWWHDFADDADFAYLLYNRLKFGDYNKTGRYPYAILVFGDYIGDALMSTLEERGYPYKPSTVPFLRSIGVHSTLSIELDDRSYGVPGDVDRNPTVEVVSSRERDDGLIEVMGVRPQDADHDVETYYLLSFPANDPTDLRCAVEHMDMKGWRGAPVESVTVEADSGVGDPFTYVC